MPTLRAEIEIQAPKSMVWAALCDKKSWQYWNTFLFDGGSVDTELNPLFTEKKSTHLMVCRSLGEGKVAFQPNVQQVQPESILSWSAKATGFQVESQFELQDINAQSTRYIHTEIFSGWLVRLIFPFMAADEQAGMTKMAAELKQYLESLPTNGQQPIINT
ncbi:MAG: SRPBCC domain-containing protein [Microcoleaceae cyanobacterium]